MSRPDPKKNITTLVRWACCAGPEAAHAPVHGVWQLVKRVATQPALFWPALAAVRLLNIPDCPCAVPQVDAFGRHAMLRELANLVLVMVGG